MGGGATVRGGHRVMQPFKVIGVVLTVGHVIPIEAINVDEAAKGHRLHHVAHRQPDEGQGHEQPHVLPQITSHHVRGQHAIGMVVAANELELAVLKHHHGDRGDPELADGGRELARVIAPAHHLRDGANGEARTARGQGKHGLVDEVLHPQGISLRLLRGRGNWRGGHVHTSLFTAFVDGWTWLPHDWKQTPRLVVVNMCSFRPVIRSPHQRKISLMTNRHHPSRDRARDA